MFDHHSPFIACRQFRIRLAERFCMFSDEEENTLVNMENHPIRLCRADVSQPTKYFLHNLVVTHELHGF